MTTINLQIPLESLLAAVSTLTLDDKQKLLAVLEQQILVEEEATYTEDPEAAAEISAVQAEYAAEEYVTLDQYLETCSESAELAG